MNKEPEQEVEVNLMDVLAQMTPREKLKMRLQMCQAIRRKRPTKKQIKTT